MDGPILLLGYTGREEESQSYVFAQEENFYYLTGHNEEGAALLLLPGGKTWVPKPETREKMKSSMIDGGLAPEILFCPLKTTAKKSGTACACRRKILTSNRKRDSARSFPTPNFAPLSKFSPWSSPPFTPFFRISANWAAIRTKRSGGLDETGRPQETVKDIRGNITDLRVIKSPTEIALLRQAIDLSLDAQLEAMKMMRPGLWEYQIAAKMVEVHAMGGSETEAYAPIVGAGPNSTALHYDKLSRKIQDGDIVVMDVGAQYSGYAADITRTIPANGKYTPRQREIYDIVLGAQNAALAALKPGAIMGCRDKKNSLFNVAYNYINSHGKDQHGKGLGQYFIHGLGHNIGLNVHDPGDSCRPLQPGMVVTVEPGIYIPRKTWVCASKTSARYGHRL